MEERKKPKQTPSEKLQDELEPISDDIDYSVADHLDEIREVEKMDEMRKRASWK